MNRLKAKYNEVVKPALAKEFDIKNPMLIPAIEKIVISVGAGESAKDQKQLQNIADTISLIAGQKAVVTDAKKSVAGFKVREGFPVGVKVTLRKENMFAFLDKLISIALPRVKDFRGLAKDGFDGRGNYNFGLNEQLMFPEVEYDKILRTHGMNIVIVTTTNSDKEAFKLLELFGLPFAKGKAARKPKFTVRGYTRCQICGRPHSVYKDFGICRVCLRKMANEGLIPGLKKASW